MENCLKYVFTDSEYAKLVSITSPDKPIHETPAKVAELRQFVRLFIKTWVASSAFNRITTYKGSRSKPVKLSSVVVACAMTYRYTYKLLQRPALSGALSGIVLAAGLPASLASYAAIYLASKLCEWIYNYADDRKLIEWKPRFLGSWVLFPAAFSQLFYSLIAHPETTPSGFKRLIVLLSNGTLAPTVLGESSPTTDQVLSGIADATSRGFPSYKSPMAFGDKATGFENAGQLEGLLLTAHPGNTSVLGAIIHPNVDEDLRFFLDSVQSNITVLAKVFVPVYLARAYFGGKSLKEALSTAIRTSFVYAIVPSSAIAGIQLSRYWLGKKAPLYLRLRLIGLLSGLWAILIQRSGHTQFLYATRLAFLSLFPQHLLNKLPFLGLPLTMAVAFTIANKYPASVVQTFYIKLANWMQYGEWRI